MSIPTYISIALINKGLYMENGRPPHVEEFELFDRNQTEGFAFISNESISIYSVDRNKVIELEDIKISKDGYLEEDLVILRSVMGIEFEMDNEDYSQTNWITNGDYAEMLGDEANMKSFYEILIKNYQFELEKSQKFNTHQPRFCQSGHGMHIGPLKSSWHDDKIFNMSFIGLFSVHTSQGYEDLYPEIDYIEFLGEGKVSLIE